jgi:hypothetical protein
VEDLTSADFSRAEENLDRVTDLVVDEISTVSGDFLHLMDKIMRIATGHEEPFGGIRVILSGDFMQLPAVHQYSEAPLRWKWSFQHPLFGLARGIVLTQSIRHQDDQDIRVLSELRRGYISAEGREVLDAMVDRDVGPTTELYPLNRIVREVNQRRLDALSGTLKTYPTWYTPHRLKNTFLKQVPIGEEVSLKVGTSVITVMNNPGVGYANGSQGVVTSMGLRSVSVKLNSGRHVEISRGTWEIRDGKGDVLGNVKGLPILQGDALTIHRAQGMTLGAVKTDVSRCWEAGHAYVDMTRTRSLKNISLVTRVKNFKVDPDALAFTRRLEERREE